MEIFMQFFGVGVVFYNIVVGFEGGGEHGAAQLFEQGLYDWIGRYADADGFLAIDKELGRFAACRQDEGERAGQVAAQQLEHRRVNLSGILGHLTDVFAHHGEHGLARVEIADAAYALYGLFGGDVAADGIYRIGGINDDAAGAEYFCGLRNFALVGVLRMDAKNHNPYFWVKK